MEVINGEFYMLGYREDDPRCIRGPEELKRLISEVGFLPLFSNTIPGVSVEERTLASAWWTGDPASDPRTTVGSLFKDWTYLVFAQQLLFRFLKINEPQLQSRFWTLSQRENPSHQLQV